MTNNQEAERAWKLLDMLAQLESLLWDSYNDYFMDVFINKTERDEPLDKLDDFPF